MEERIVEAKKSLVSPMPALAELCRQAHDAQGDDAIQDLLD